MTNNFSCFQGVEYQYWSKRAEGYNPNIVTSPDGVASLQYDFESSHEPSPAVTQNGGISFPQETKLKNQLYFRFVSTKNYSDYGRTGFLGGNWWIDYDTLNSMRIWAQEHDVPLSQAAKLLLILPDSFSDAAFLGAALRRAEIRAFVGKGKPASDDFSPDSPLRKDYQKALHAGLPHLEVKQYFVPGKPKLLEAMFQYQWSGPVGRKSDTLPRSFW